ncbi:MAG: hypothetical protein ACE5HA_11000 [Anaerolineae bacterium]
MRRSVGVALGAVGYFFVAGLFLLFVFGVADPEMWWIVRDANVKMGEPAFVAISGIFAIVGWGLLTLKSWGRIAALVLILLDFMMTLFGAGIFGLEAPSFIRAVLGLVLFFYLDSPDIKAAFHADQSELV